MIGFARALSTWFYTGLSPKAPGTVGSLATLPLFWAIQYFSNFAYWLVTAAITVLGCWVSEIEAKRSGKDDPGHIVIDEVAGMLIALIPARGQGVIAMLTAFGLFRLFDIWKPGPVKAVESLKPKGIGIMADDVVAGYLAFLVLYTMVRLHVFQ